MLCKLLEYQNESLIECIKQDPLRVLLFLVFSKRNSIFSKIFVMHLVLEKIHLLCQNKTMAKIAIKEK